MTTQVLKQVLVVCLAAGCALGPTYQRPSVQAPTQWKTDLSIEWKPADPQDATPRGAWWELFDDPALNLLEVQAVHVNHTLHQALARVTQARAIARIRQADLQPTLESNPSYTNFQRSTSGFGGGEGTFTTSTFSIPFDLSYEVDLWGKVRRSFEAAQADAQASQAAYDSAWLLLTAEVAQNYVLLRALDAELEILRRTIALRGEALRLVDARLEAGIVSELEVARARTELATAEAEAVDLRRRRAELENALAVLCGQPAPEFQVSEGPLPQTLPSIPSGIPSTVLERRPDIAEFERAVAVANARIGVAQAAFFPVLTLTGSAGYETATFDSLFSTDSKVWSLGPSLSIPLFAGGRNKANLLAARAEHEEAVAGYRQRVLVAFQEVENALANVARRTEQADVQHRVVSAAQEAAKLSDIRYQQGLVDYFEVVDAERSRLQAEQGAVQIRSQRLISTVLLIKSLGGSWHY